MELPDQPAEASPSGILRQTPQSLASQSEGLVGDTCHVLRRVEVALSDDNQARFAGILAKLEKATGELPDRAGRTRDPFDGLLIDARAAMASFDRSITALGDMTEAEELRATVAAARCLERGCCGWGSCVCTTSCPGTR